MTEAQEREVGRLMLSFAVRYKANRYFRRCVYNNPEVLKTEIRRVIEAATGE